MISKEIIRNSLYGAIVGDALGVPFDRNVLKEWLKNHSFFSETPRLETKKDSEMGKGQAEQE